MDNLSENRRVEKPWGHEIIWAHTEKYVGKILCIKAGHQLSVQYHRVKEETLYMLKGEMELLHADSPGQPLKSLVLRPGDRFHVPTGLVHRMKAISDCEVAEVSTPHLDDVVRIEDSYGRAGS